jgi:hypothetical protein
LSESCKLGELQPPAGRARLFLVRRTEFAELGFEFQPAVPVLPTTLLQLDLLLSQPTLDLNGIVAVLLSDIGATLQVLRKAARCLAKSNARAGDLDDCVVHLGRLGLRHAMSSPVPSEECPQSEKVRCLWRRARITASLAQTIASRFPEIPPKQARLAGLLHETGCLPLILGWRLTGIDLEDSVAVGGALVREWQLPEFLTPTRLGSHGGTWPSSPLNQIVTAAWGLANAITQQESCCQANLLPGPGWHAGALVSQPGFAQTGLSPYRPIRIE